MQKNTRKANNNLLAQQVKSILHEKGLSKIFNEEDFNYFKRQANKAFNKAQAIADLFIDDNCFTVSDYHDYIF
jgi:hypothetical protein